MRMRNSWIAGLSFGVMLGATAVAASHHGQPNNSPPPASPPPPPASQPSVPSQFSQDETAQVAAAAELATDEANLKAISDADWAKFQQTPDWIAAQSKVTDAQSALDAAKQAASDALANNADYQAAVASKQKAADDLAAAKASGDATPETLSPLAAASLQATIRLRQITSSVQANDTGVQTATANLLSAQYVSDLLKVKFQRGLSSDRAYAAAKAVVDSAQKRYDDAHAKLVSDNGGV